MKNFAFELLVTMLALKLINQPLLGFVFEQKGTHRKYISLIFVSNKRENANVGNKFSSSLRFCSYNKRNFSLFFSKQKANSIITKQRHFVTAFAVSS